jgi:hypothetical protein
MADEENELINLGESIQLSGFKIISSGELVVVKKLIGTQVRKFQDMLPGFERLVIHLKPIHKTEKNMQFEIAAELIYEGKVKNSNVVDRNLFMGLSTIFNKFEIMLQKK